MIVKGTVKKVSRGDPTKGRTLTLHRTDPAPEEDVEYEQIDGETYADARAALCGGKPVELRIDDITGTIIGVTIG